MQNIHFYLGEVKGSEDEYSFYIEAKTATEAENKLISYYDNYLMSTSGEMTSISIVEVEAAEYYGKLKIDKYSFI